MSEHDLIAAAKTGCPDSFTALMKRHQDRLYRFLMVRSHCAADAQDALQETFLIAFRSIHTYRTKWAFTTWLYRIALRELARMASGIESSLLEEPCGDDWESCIGELDRGNLWREVQSVLPSAQFNVVWLLYAEDFSVRSVAQTLDRSIPWVKMAAYRARARLARSLDADWRNYAGQAAAENRTG